MYCLNHFTNSIIDVLLAYILHTRNCPTSNQLLNYCLNTNAKGRQEPLPSIHYLCLKTDAKLSRDNRIGKKLDENLYTDLQCHRTSQFVNKIKF